MFWTRCPALRTGSGRRGAELVEELVGEQAGTDAGGGAVELADGLDQPSGARALAAAVDDLEGQAGTRPAHDRVARALRQSLEAEPGEEADVVAVEDAAAVVVEPAERDPGPRVPVAEVRHRRDQRPGRREQRHDLLEDPIGPAH